MAKSLENRLADLRASLELDRRFDQMRQGQRSGVPGTTARAEATREQVEAGADPTVVAQRQLSSTAGGQAAPSDLPREPDVGAAVMGGAAAALPMAAMMAPAAAGAAAMHPKAAIAAAVALDQAFGTHITQSIISRLMGQ